MFLKLKTEFTGYQHGCKFLRMRRGYVVYFGDNEGIELDKWVIRKKGGQEWPSKSVSYLILVQVD
jgi:hypothetical protein